MGLSLPLSLRKRLEKEAKRSDLAMATVVQMALSSYLNRKELEAVITGK